MAISIDELYFQVMANTSPFDDAVEKSVKGAASKFQSLNQNAAYKPRIDESDLYHFNEHIDLKQKHWAELGEDLRKGAVARVELKEFQRDLFLAEKMLLAFKDRASVTATAKAEVDDTDLIRVAKNIGYIGQALDTVSRPVKLKVETESIDYAWQKVTSLQTRLSQPNRIKIDDTEARALFNRGSFSYENKVRLVLDRSTVNQLSYAISDAVQVGVGGGFGAGMANIITSPLRLVKNIFSEISTGFLREIGAGLSDGLGARRTARRQGSRAGNFARTVDEEVVGVGEYLPAFAAEFFRSGNVRKANSAAFERSKTKAVTDAFQKLGTISTLGDDMDKVSEFPELMALIPPEKMESFKKLGGKAFLKKNKSEAKAIKAKAEQMIYELSETPAAVVDRILNPMLQELSPLLNFVNKMQINRAIGAAKQKMLRIEPLFPVLSGDEQGIVNVVGGAMNKSGHGHGEIVNAFEPIIENRRLLGIQNKHTDPTGELPQGLASTLYSLVSKHAPGYTSGPAANTVKNMMIMIERAINPVYEDPAVVDALANSMVARKKGVPDKSISTISYSLGGAVARDVASGYQMLGMKSPVAAMAYPDINAYKPNLPNFRAFQIQQDAISFPKTVLGIGQSNNYGSYDAGLPIAGSEAHAYKHLFKSPELTQDFFSHLNLRNPGGDLPRMMDVGSQNYRALGAAKHVESIIHTGDFDPKAAFHIGEKDNQMEMFQYLAESLAKLPPVNETGSPKQIAVYKAMVDRITDVYNQMVGYLGALGMPAENMASPKELSANLVMRAEAGGINRSIKSLLNNKMSKSGDAWFAADLNPQEVGARLLPLKSAMEYFGKILDKNAPSAQKLQQGFQQLEILMKEFAATGKISEQTRAASKYIEFPSTPKLDWISDVKRDFKAMPVPTFESQRKYQEENAQPWMYKSPEAVMAYNAMLAKTDRPDLVPPVQNIKQAAFGMSGAAAMLSDDFVYKHDVNDPQKIASENEVKAYEMLKGRYAPLLYHAEPGKMLITERIQGKPLKDILDEKAKPAKAAQAAYQKIREELQALQGSSPDDQEGIAKLRASVVEARRVFRQQAALFNKEAEAMYLKVGQLGKALQEMGVAHGDLASGNVFVKESGEFTAIDLGNAMPNPTAFQKLQDKATTIQRAVIDIDYWGLLNPKKTASAIHQGYANPLPQMEPRQALESDLPKYSPNRDRAVMLGSLQKSQLEEELDYNQYLAEAEIESKKRRAAYQQRKAQSYKPEIGGYDPFATARDDLAQRQSQRRAEQEKPNSILAMFASITDPFRLVQPEEPSPQINPFEANDSIQATTLLNRIQLLLTNRRESGSMMDAVQDPWGENNKARVKESYAQKFLNESGRNLTKGAKELSRIKNLSQVDGINIGGISAMERELESLHQQSQVIVQAIEVAGQGQMNGLEVADLRALMDAHRKAIKSYNKQLADINKAGEKVLTARIAAQSKGIELPQYQVDVAPVAPTMPMPPVTSSAGLDQSMSGTTEWAKDMTINAPKTDLILNEILGIAQLIERNMHGGGRGGGGLATNPRRGGGPFNPPQDYTDRQGAIVPRPPMSPVPGAYEYLEGEIVEESQPQQNRAERLKQVGAKAARTAGTALVDSVRQAWEEIYSEMAATEKALLDVMPGANASKAFLSKLVAPMVIYSAATKIPGIGELGQMGTSGIQELLQMGVGDFMQQPANTMIDALGSIIPKANIPMVGNGAEFAQQLVTSLKGAVEAGSVATTDSIGSAITMLLGGKTLQNITQKAGQSLAGKLAGGTDSGKLSSGRQLPQLSAESPTLIAMAQEEFGVYVKQEADRKLKANQLIMSDFAEAHQLSLQVDKTLEQMKIGYEGFKQKAAPLKRKGNRNTVGINNIDENQIRDIAHSYLMTIGMNTSALKNAEEALDAVKAMRDIVDDPEAHKALGDIVQSMGEKIGAMKNYSTSRTGVQNSLIGKLVAPAERDKRVGPIFMGEVEQGRKSAKPFISQEEFEASKSMRQILNVFKQRNANTEGGFIDPKIFSTIIDAVISPINKSIDYISKQGRALFAKASDSLLNRAKFGKPFDRNLPKIEQPPEPPELDPAYNQEWGRYYDARAMGTTPQMPPMLAGPDLFYKHYEPDDPNLSTKDTSGAMKAAWIEFANNPIPEMPPPPSRPLGKVESLFDFEDDEITTGFSDIRSQIKSAITRTKSAIQSRLQRPGKTPLGVSPLDVSGGLSQGFLPGMDEGFDLAQAGGLIPAPINSRKPGDVEKPIPKPQPVSNYFTAAEQQAFWEQKASTTPVLSSYNPQAKQMVPPSIANFSYDYMETPSLLDLPTESGGGKGGGGGKSGFWKSFSEGFEGDSLFKKALDSIKEAAGFAEENLGGLFNTIKLVGGVLLGGVGFMGLLAWVKVFGDFSAQALRAQGALQLFQMQAINATGSKSAANQLLVRSQTTARAEGLNLNSVRDADIQFRAATKDTVIEGASAQFIADAIRKGASARGLNNDQTQRATVGFLQAIGKEQLMPEELTGQIAEAGFFDIKPVLAKSLGVSTTNLEKLSRTRQLGIPEIMKLAGQISSDANSSGADRSKTLEGTFSRLGNSGQIFMESFGEKMEMAQPIMELIASSIEVISANLQNLLSILGGGVLYLLAEFAMTSSKGALSLSHLGNVSGMTMNVIKDIGIQMAKTLGPIALAALAFESLRVSIGAAIEMAQGKSIFTEIATEMETAANKAEIAAGKLKPGSQPSEGQRAIQDKNFAAKDWLLGGLDYIKDPGQRGKKDMNLLEQYGKALFTPVALGLNIAGLGKTQYQYNQEAAKVDTSKLITSSAPRMIDAANTVLADSKSIQEIANLKDEIAQNDIARQRTSILTPEGQAEQERLTKRGRDLNTELVQKSQKFTEAESSVALAIKKIDEIRESGAQPENDAILLGLRKELELSTKGFQNINRAVSETTRVFQKATDNLARYDRALSISKSLITIQGSVDSTRLYSNRQNQDNDRALQFGQRDATIETDKRTLAALQADLGRRKAEVEKMRSVAPAMDVIPLDPIADKEKYDKVIQLEREVAATRANARKFQQSGGEDAFADVLRMDSEALRKEQEIRALKESKPNLGYDDNKVKALKAEEDKLLQIQEEAATKFEAITRGKVERRIELEREAVARIGRLYDLASLRDSIKATNQQADLIPIVANETRGGLESRTAQTNVQVAKQDLLRETQNRNALKNLISSGEVKLTAEDARLQILQADQKVADRRKALLEAEKASYLAMTNAVESQMNRLKSKIDAFNAQMDRNVSMFQTLNSRAAITPVNYNQSFRAIDVSPALKTVADFQNQQAELAGRQAKVSNRYNALRTSPEALRGLTTDLGGTSPGNATLEQLTALRDRYDQLANKTPEITAQYAIVGQLIEIQGEQLQIEQAKTGLVESAKNARQSIFDKMKEINKAYEGLANAIASETRGIRDEVRNAQAELKANKYTNNVREALLGVTGIMGDYVEGLVGLIEAAGAIARTENERKVQLGRNLQKYSSRGSELDKIAEDRAALVGSAEIINKGIPNVGDPQRSPYLVDRFSRPGNLPTYTDNPSNLVNPNSPAAPNIQGANVNNQPSGSPTNSAQPSTSEGKTIIRRTAEDSPVRITTPGEAPRSSSVSKERSANQEALRDQDKVAVDKAKEQFRGELLKYDTQNIRNLRELANTLRSTQRSGIDSFFKDRELDRSGRTPNYLDQDTAIRDETFKSYLGEAQQIEDQRRSLSELVAKTKDAPGELQKGLDSLGLTPEMKEQIQTRLDAFGVDTKGQFEYLASVIQELDKRATELPGRYSRIGNLRITDAAREQQLKLNAMASTSQIDELRTMAATPDTDKYSAASLTGAAAIIEQKAAFSRGLIELREELKKTNLAGTEAGRALEESFTRINDLKLDKIRREANLMRTEIENSLDSNFSRSILEAGTALGQAFDRLVQPGKYNAGQKWREVGDSIVDALKSLGGGILGSMAKIAADIASAKISKFLSKGLTDFVTGILGIPNEADESKTPSVPTVKTNPIPMTIPELPKPSDMKAVEKLVTNPTLNPGASNRNPLAPGEAQAVPQGVSQEALRGMSINPTPPVAQSGETYRVWEDIRTRKYDMDFSEMVRRNAMPEPPENITPLPRPSEVLRRQPIGYQLGHELASGKGRIAPNADPSTWSVPAPPAWSIPDKPAPERPTIPPAEMVESGKQLADGFSSAVQQDGELLQKLKPGEYGNYLGEGQQFRVEPEGKSGKGKGEKSPLDVTITNTAEELFGVDLGEVFSGFSKEAGSAISKGGDVGGNLMGVAGNALVGAAATGVGNLTRDLFKSLKFFKYGGEIGEDDMNIPVQRFAMGGLAGANIAGYDSRAIDAAMRAEGGASAGAMLAVVHRGEHVLSDLTGDAQLYQDMLLSGEWSQRRSGHSPDYVSNFAFGGSVGNTASGRSGSGGGKGSVVHQDNSTTFVINSDKSAMDEFRRSQDQIQLQQSRKAARSKNYNG